MTRIKNPCFNAPRLPCLVPEDHWMVRFPFTPSHKGLLRYANFHEHDLVIDHRKTPPSPTFDEKALEKLQAKYPGDPIYSKLGLYREIEKARGTYVDGMRSDANHRVHGVFNHNPSTLRLAMKDPSLQTMPRIDPKVPSVYNEIKTQFVAKPGHVFLGCDFSGIEAVIVFYLAGDRDGVRLAKEDVHSFFASHVVGEAADVSWPDEELFPYLKGIKERHKPARQACKAIVHASHYLTTPYKIHLLNPVLFPDTKTARKFQNIYLDDLFPSIKKWQWQTCVEADKQGYLVAPDGFRQHFGAAMMWAWSDKNQQWEQDYGPQAKEAVACIPQHMGMSYIARATNTLFHEHYEEVGQYLRLLIHDEIFLEVPEEKCDSIQAIVEEVMQRPHPDMPLPESWEMGKCLSIGVESKRGKSWSDMR